MNDLEKGYIAGFLEGEGCFTRRKDHGIYYAEISAGQKDFEPLEKIASLLGGKIYQISTSNLYIWKLLKEKEIFNLIDEIYLLLSKRRRDQIDTMKKFHKSKIIQ